MILIKNANIYNVKNNNFENGMILVDHGKIIAIGNDVRPPRNAEIINVKGKFVMPGMMEDGISFECAGIDGKDYSLEIGNDANIVIYSGHPFDLRSKVEFIMVNGEISKK